LATITLLDHLLVGRSETGGLGKRRLRLAFDVAKGVEQDLGDADRLWPSG
jgi:hypothetical protein